MRVYDAAGNLIETHEHAGEFKETEVLPELM
jgi:YD repeat-containing protein